MPYVQLPQRALLRLTGDDTVPFLQGLVTNDVTRLKQAGVLYAALLTPQGKYLHDFFLIGCGDAVVIDIDRTRMNDLTQRLSMYKLRSHVTIESLTATHGITVIWDIGDKPFLSSPNLQVLRDPRVESLGWRISGDLQEAAEWCEKQSWERVNPESYDALRLSHGIPEGAGRDMVPERSFLLPFGFEDLHGVDFHKGCYVGQEVTARSKHLAQLRKFIFKVESVSGALPEAGTAIYLGDRAAGELRSSRGGAGVALMSVEELQKARTNKGQFTCGGAIISVKLPLWAAQDIQSAEQT